MITKNVVGIALSLERGVSKKDEKPYLFHQIQIQQEKPNFNVMARCFVNNEGEALKPGTAYVFDVAFRNGQHGLMPQFYNPREFIPAKAVK